jgi:hypothetical protein
MRALLLISECMTMNIIMSVNKHFVLSLNNQDLNDYLHTIQRLGMG